MNEPAQIFVTGATGFIGRRFLAALDRSRYPGVVCLVRTHGALPGERCVVGRLEDADSYASCLGPGTTVVHLAALTGKAAPDRYQAVNVDGTSQLVAACQRAGVKRLVHVSTIAVTYREKSRYPYARSKEAAEAVVRASGLDHRIVRPTIVLGEGSPASRSFALLARPWLTIVPGSGRARVQPIDVDDVARFLAGLLESDGGPSADTLDLGGPDVWEIGDFLARLGAKGGSRPPVLHLPLAPMVGVLSWLEGPLLRFLPITAGQLSVFAQDGVAAPHPLASRATPSMKRLLRGTGEPDAGGTLDAECAVFSRYLCDQLPGEYVRQKYREAHDRIPALAGTSADPFDDTLLTLARRHPALTRLADAYARAFAVRARVRVKLIVLLAILESCAPAHRHYDSPDTPSVATLAFRAAVHVLASTLALLGAALVLHPLRLLRGRRAAPRER